MSEAVFTDVIDVTFDTAALEQSLNAFVDLYKSKMEELGSINPVSQQFSDLVNVSAIKDSLVEVQSELKGVVEAFMAGFAQVATASGESGAQVAANVQQSLSAVDSAVAKSAKYQLEQLSLSLKDGDEAYAAFATAAAAALEGKLNPAIGTTAQLQKNLYDFISNGAIVAFADLDAAQQQWFTRYKFSLKEQVDLGGEIIAMTNRRRAEEVALGNDIITITARAQAEQEKLGADTLAVLARRRAEEEALGTAILAIINRERQEQIALGNEVIAIYSRERQEQEALGNSIVALINRQRQEQIALGNEIIALKNRERQAEEELGAATIAIINRERQAQEALGNDIIAITRRERAEQEALGESIIAATRNTAAAASRPSSGIFGSLKDQIVGLAEMQIEWDLIQGAIDLATKSVDAFFGFFKDGIAYMADVETRAAALQGILASNVKFAEDTATNFQLAGVAATNLTREIQDAAIRYGISVDILTRSFKSFTDSGGTALVNGVEEALQASTLLSVAIKASGKDTETTRSALSEIPKLLDGTITSTSKILETLGISTTQWKAMNAEARSHHDLLQQLQPILEPYLKVAEDSANRFDAIKQTLQLIYDRTAGLAAQEFWPALKADLQAIRDYLEENKDKIAAIATVIGDVGKAFFEFVGQKPLLDAMMFGFQLLAAALVIVKTKLFEIVTEMLGVYHAYELIQDIDPTNILKNGFSAYRKSVEEDLNGIFDAINAHTGHLSDMASEIDAIFHPVTPPAPPPTPEGTGKKLPADNEKLKKDALQELMKQYKDLETQLHTASEKERNDIALNLAQRLISVKEAAEQTALVNEAEFQAQVKLIEQIRQVGDAYTKVPANAKKAFDATLTQDSDNLLAKKQKEDLATALKGIEDTNKATDQGLAQRDAALTKFQSQSLAKIQANVKAGITTESAAALQVLAVETTVHNQRIALLNEELTADGKVETLRQATLQKIKDADAAYTAAVQANAAARILATAHEAELFVATVAARGKAEITSAQTETGEKKNRHESDIQSQEDQIKLLEVYAKVATANYAAATASLAVRLANGEVGKSIQELITKQRELKEQSDAANAAVSGAKAREGLNDPISQAVNDVQVSLKDTFASFGSDAKTFAVSFTTSVTALTNAMNVFAQAGAKIGDDLAKGNVGGAVGDSISAAGGIVSGIGGLFKSLGAAPGVIGAVAGAVGGMVSMISGFFTAAAKQTAADIKKQFDASVQAYNDGSATLAATIAAVEQEKIDAITRLSGQKGGQDQLNQLLPTLDAEIKTLQQQADTIISNFNTSLEKLRLNQDALGAALDTWTQINKQIQDYIGAGGDAAQAAQFLSLSLEKMKEDAATQLSSGESDAINQALKLNDLLAQRKTLIDNYNKAKFESLNADALERRASNAVTIGMNQKAADDAQKKALDDLNQQITTAQTEVSMYSQIYTIASDTAALKAESSALEIQNLAKTIAQLQSYAKIYEGIYKTSTGTYATTNGAGTGIQNPLAAAQTTTIGNLNLNITTTGPVDAAALASTLETALKDRGRYGAGTYVLTAY